MHEVVALNYRGVALLWEKTQWGGHDEKSRAIIGLNGSSASVVVVLLRAWRVLLPLRLRLVVRLPLWRTWAPDVTTGTSLRCEASETLYTAGSAAI